MNGRARAQGNLVEGFPPHNGQWLHQLCMQSFIGMPEPPPLEESAYTAQPLPGTRAAVVDKTRWGHQQSGRAKSVEQGIRGECELLLPHTTCNDGLIQLLHIAAHACCLKVLRKIFAGCLPLQSNRTPMRIRLMLWFDGKELPHAVLLHEIREIAATLALTRGHQLRCVQQRVHGLGFANLVQRIGCVKMLAVLARCRIVRIHLGHGEVVTSIGNEESAVGAQQLRGMLDNVFLGGAFMRSV